MGIAPDLSDDHTLNQGRSLEELAGWETWRWQISRWRQAKIQPWNLNLRLLSSFVDQTNSISVIHNPLHAPRAPSVRQSSNSFPSHWACSPHCYRLLLFLFTVRDYLSSKRRWRWGKHNHFEVSMSTCSTSWTTSAMRERRSTSMGYNFWRGVQDFVRPKWGGFTWHGRKFRHSVSIASKQKPKKSSSASVKLSTVKLQRIMESPEIY
jgi:hypothetical protein